jgi:tRNA A-37 threonylcarbamoyl transferase component Bud32
MPFDFRKHHGIQVGGPAYPDAVLLDERSDAGHAQEQPAPALVVRSDERAHASANARMHPLTLRFAGPLEDEFADEYFARTLTQVRAALVLGLALYTVFGILDTWIAPAQRETLWLIRYAIVAPLLLIVIGFTYHSSFKRYRERVISIAVLGATLGIVAMTAIIPAPGNYLYYAGLILAIVYTFTLVRLSLPFSTSISAFTISAYLVVALSMSGTPPELIVNNMFFLGATVVIGFSANYSMSKYARTIFLQRRVIEAHTAQLQEKNQELLAKNQMLAESRAATLRTARRSELIFSALAETLPGTVLDDKYRLAEKIGSGNFGTVYRGEHIYLHHPVAVKVFRPAVGQVALESIERFRLEGISACRINHPNAVTVLDFDVSAGSLAYLVMELLHGRSLADELRIEGRMSSPRCADVAASVCDALAEAHVAGIVHRDIKPSNVFLHYAHSEQLVKVIDFGIAKLTDTSAQPDVQVSTVAGMFVGTPSYMAPERLLEEPYDGRADVYSVGVMMYEMLSGRLPFEVGDAGYWSLARMHIVEQPPSLTAMDAGIPSEMEAIVFDALAKTPDKRPTAEKLGARLRDFLIKAPLQPSPARE